MTGTDHKNGDQSILPTVSQKTFFGIGTKVAGPGIVAFFFVLLAFLTWRKWPDLIVDFGTQLYIPWRLSEGSVLYRDLYYFAGGPLSQYFNAALFRIFGVSFSTLIGANLILTGAMVAFIYRRFLATADALTATIVCLGIVVVFAFSQYTGTGNYNYIAPYSHEALHGLIISVFTIGLLADWVSKGRTRSILLVGFCSGLVFLTKPDIFLALASCTVAAFAMCGLDRQKKFSVGKSLAAYLVMLTAPAAVFFLFFLREEGWRMSLRSVVFGWLPVFTPAIRNNVFYRSVSGMDNPSFHVHTMAIHFFSAIVAIIVYAVLFRRRAVWKTNRFLLQGGIWLALVSPLFVWAWTFDWLNCGYTLPFWCLSALVLLGWNRKALIGGQRFVFPFLWCFFSLFLMAKLGVFPRISHYGFVLAMPALVATIFFLYWLLPKLLEDRYQVPAKYLRALFLAIFLISFIVLFNDSNKMLRQKRLAIGQAADRIVTFGPSYDIGEIFKIALNWVDTNVPTNGTLAVLPDGITLNYLSRRINPTPCLFWDPNVMTMFGQDRMTSLFEQNAPDYIVVIEQDQRDLGVGYFGSFPGYGVELMQWINKNYQTAQLIGSEPLRDGNFGIKIMRRQPSPH